MLIRRQLLLGCITGAFAIAASVAYLIDARMETERLLELNKTSTDISRSVAGLLAATSDLDSDQRARAVRQWLSHHESMGRFLVKLQRASVPDSTEIPEITADLLDRHGALGRLFRSLMISPFAAGSEEFRLQAAVIVGRLTAEGQLLAEEDLRLQRILDGHTARIQIATQWSAVAALGLMGLIVAAGCVLILYRVLRPLQQLDRAARQAAGGDYDDARIVARDGNEFGHAAEAFNHMVDTVRDREQRLKESYDRLAAATAELDEIFNLSVDMLAVVGRDGHLHQLNPAWTETLGWNPDELTSRPIADYLHPDDRHEAVRLFTVANDMPATLVNRFRDRNGRYRHLEWHGRKGNDGRLFTVARDITDRLQSQRQLEESLAALKQRNEELDEFTHVASHDLKAPLNAISQLARWVREDAGDELSAESMEHLALLGSRAERLRVLLDDLLAYARTGREEAAVETIDAAASARRIFELIGDDRLTLVLPDKTESVTVPRVPFETVLHNLFSNAAKHHDRTSGRVELLSEHEPDSYRFGVRDDGPGIAPEHQEKVFAAFQTLKPRDEIEASGMGLAFVRKLVHIYGGSVWVESDGVRGTTIWFTWPGPMDTVLKVSEKW